MKELQKKTGFSLIAILSLFLVTVLIYLNVNIYLREEEGIRRALNILEGPVREIPPGPGPDGRTEPDAAPRDMKNMMIMDHELYTVELREGEIGGIYPDSGSGDFDAAGIARKILSSEATDRIRIGNLYFSDYSYRYRLNESIVITNDREIRKKLWDQLAGSAVIFLLMEVLILWVSYRITGWITGPAKEAFTRQKEFIADASHELKTPLAVIMASADELHVNAKDSRYLENIRYESDRMNRLITELLDLSRLDGEESMEVMQEEDLSRILEKTCMAYEAVAYEKGVGIETKIEEGMTFRCDRSGIEQMAATILDNAVRHSYRDTTVRVLASLNQSGKEIDIRVINTGDPIPEEDREKIFERFYRGDSSRSREGNHYGLGLAIAKKIAQLHHGDIEAISEAGDTVFHIVLR